MCRVSVIIPTYNTEAFIEPCIRSLQQGTYGDYELLVVDDGSTDGTVSVCSRLQEEDDRIRVLREPHKGVGHARNAGLRRARGAYVAFVDGDDLLAEDYLQTLLEWAVRERLDWISCNQQRFQMVDGVRRNESGDAAVFREDRLLLAPDCGDALTRAVFLGEARWGLWSNCMGLYRRDFLLDHALWIPEDLAYGEDMVFNLMVAGYVERFAYLHDRLYLARVWDRSSSQQMLQEDIISPTMELTRALSRVLETTGGWEDHSLSWFYQKLTYSIRMGILPQKGRVRRRRAWETYEAALASEDIAAIWKQVRWKYIPHSPIHWILFPMMRMKLHRLIGPVYDILMWVRGGIAQ